MASRPRRPFVNHPLTGMSKPRTGGFAAFSPKLNKVEIEAIEDGFWKQASLMRASSDIRAFGGCLGGKRR